jgi:hypothetical protein
MAVAEEVAAAVLEAWAVEVAALSRKVSSALE